MRNFKLTNFRAVVITLSIIGLIIAASFQKAPKDKKVKQTETNTLSKDTTKPSGPKVYTVTLTLDQWVRTINGIQYTTSRIRQSDLPSKEVSLITDSVLAPIYGEINAQIGKQLEAEKKSADSSANKKPETNKKN